MLIFWGIVVKNRTDVSIVNMRRGKNIFWIGIGKEHMAYRCRAPELVDPAHAKHQRPVSLARE